MRKRSKILIGILMVIMVVLLVGISFMVLRKREAGVTFEGTVLEIGDSYLLVSDGKGEEYQLDVDDTYQVGDKVAVMVSHVKKHKEFYQGTVEEITLLSQNVNFTIHDEKEDDVSFDEQEATEKQEEVLEENREEQGDVIAYFESLNQNLEKYESDKSLGQSIKEKFVTVVDFLFYGGTIYGKTFEELSTTAKLKVLKLIFTIDAKIDQYFPSYKEEISKTTSRVYTSVKAYAIQKYLDITTSVCQNDPNLCQTAKKDLGDLKHNFTLTWEFIKEISGVGVTKLKEWYEIWKET